MQAKKKNLGLASSRGVGGDSRQMDQTANTDNQNEMCW